MISVRVICVPFGDYGAGSMRDFLTKSVCKGNFRLACITYIIYRAYDKLSPLKYVTHYSFMLC